MPQMQFVAAATTMVAGIIVVMELFFYFQVNEILTHDHRSKALSLNVMVELACGVRMR